MYICTCYLVISAWDWAILLRSKEFRRDCVDLPRQALGTELGKMSLEYMVTCAATQLGEMSFFCSATEGGKGVGLSCRYPSRSKVGWAKGWKKTIGKLGSNHVSLDDMPFAEVKRCLFTKAYWYRKVYGSVCGAVLFPLSSHWWHQFEVEGRELRTQGGLYGCFQK